MRTRGPDSAANDDFLDTEFLHRLLNYAPEPRHADFVRLHVVALDVHAAQDQRSAGQFHLGHHQDAPNDGSNSGNDDVLIRLLANDFSIIAAPHALYTQFA